MKKMVASILLVLTLIVSCTTVDQNGNTKINNTTIGAGIGAAAGAVLGQLIGKDTKGTLIGTAGGAAVGTAIGAIFDKQERDLRNSLSGTGVEVKRTGEGEIKLVAPENITFDVNSATVKPVFQKTLSEVSTVLNEYKNSTIVISGHTDSTGTDAINNPLSENRAKAVSIQLISNGVANSRITTIGYGSKSPVASNTTAEGRAQNRRVEIKIVANQ